MRGYAEWKSKEHTSFVGYSKRKGGTYTCTIHMHNTHVQYTCTVHMYSTHVQQVLHARCTVCCTVCSLLRSLRPSSLLRMKTIVLCLYRPHGWTYVRTYIMRPNSTWSPPHTTHVRLQSLDITATQFTAYAGNIGTVVHETRTDMP